MQINWFWLIVGLVPYTIKRQEAKDEQIMTLKALFWQLIIHWGNGHRSWDLSVLLVKHLGQ